MRWWAGVVLTVVVSCVACSEPETTPGFTPSSPTAAESTQIEIVGPCRATADVALEEDDDQIVVSAVWRGGVDGDCAATETLDLDDPVGERDLVDRDTERRWALVDDVWVSIDWCGIDARCDEDADI